MEKELFNWKRFSITLGLVLLTATIVGGITWYYMNETLETQKETINSQQVQLDKLREGFREEEATTTEDAEEDETPVTDWKTYRNEHIGIEFQYPYDWQTLKPDDRGDIMKDGKTYTSFSLNLPDLSHLDHTLLDYDNMPIDIQYEKIKCQQDDPLTIECEEKISSNGVKYIWNVIKTKGDPCYSALVATGRYILIFSFQEKENYEKKADQYQQLLSTLKIPE